MGEAWKDTVALIVTEFGRTARVNGTAGTDHGMVEFTTNADGSRTPTRITDGYLQLLADWIKADMHGNYGSAQPVR